MTPAVALRPLAAEDEARLLGWRNRDDVRRWMFHPDPIAPDAHARWLTAALCDQTRRDWIVLADGAPVGLASLTAIAVGAAQLGYYLGEPAWRGRGVWRRAQALVLDQAFGPLALTRVSMEAFVENEASWRMQAGFGFLESGRRVQDGRLVVALTLTAEAWRSR